MAREASAPTAASGCHTDCTIIPALQMPYTGGRVVFASRASSPAEEGRGAYAKWPLRSSASSDEIRKELTRKGRSGDRDWTRGNILCQRKAESEVQPCSNSFHWNGCCTQPTHLPSLDEYYLHRKRNQTVQATLSPGPTHPSEQVIRDPTR
jgi:hypothetical protein